VTIAPSPAQIPDPLSAWAELKRTVGVDTDPADLERAALEIRETGDVPAQTHFTTDLGQEFTFCAWVWATDLVCSGPGGFSTTSPPWAEAGSETPRGAVLRVRNRFAEFVYQTGERDWASVAGKAYLTTDRWIHIALTRASDTLRLYVDGQLDTETRDPRAVPVLERATVGHAGGARRWRGRLADVRVYDRCLDTAGRHALAQLRGHTPIPVPDVHPRWHRAGVLLREPGQFPPYRALSVGDRTLHPLAEGCGILFCVVPWSSPEALDLLIGADPTLFGSRLSVHRRVGWDPTPPSGIDRLPFYDSGTTLETPGLSVGLHSRWFAAWPRADGGFHLLGDSPPLLFYRNTAPPGSEPRFSAPEPVLFDGVPLGSAVDRSVCGWAIGDLTDDGRPDVLIATRDPRPASPFPAFEGSLSQPQSNIGQGKGYGVDGTWLGGMQTATLWWAPGLAAPEETAAPAFGPVQPVFTGLDTPDFQVQWRSHLAVLSPAVLSSDGRTWIVLFGDVDNLLALPVVRAMDSGLLCDRAIPFLEGGERLRGTYFTNALAAADVDRDGDDEVLIGGNPGRVLVLKGERPGSFRELGPLRVQGGWVATDTLATPCRTLWDDDPFPDLLVGDSSGLLSFWPGTGDPLVYGTPRYLTSAGRQIRHRAGYSGSLQGPGEGGWGYLQPTVGDWDDDGLADVITNDIRAEVLLYKRAEAPFDLNAPRPLTLNGDPLPAAWRARPAILGPELDFAHSGRACLLHLDRDSHLAVAVPAEPGITVIERVVRIRDVDGRPIRMSGHTYLSGRTKLSVADWDGDGDCDLVFGTNYACHSAFLEDPPPCATPLWMENLGTNTEPVLREPRVIRLRSGDLINLRVHNCSPWATDLDGDGELDLVCGAEDGKVYAFLRHELVW
jgi:hypothetical protein